MTTASRVFIPEGTQPKEGSLAHFLAPVTQDLHPPPGNREGLQKALSYLNNRQTVIP